MSAQPCGCDPQENYVCRVHAEAIEKAVFAAPEYEDARDVEEMALASHDAADFTDLNRRMRERLATALDAPARSNIDDLINDARAFNHETSRQMNVYIKTDDFKARREAGIDALTANTQDIDAYTKRFAQDSMIYNHAASEAIARGIAHHLAHIARVLATFHASELSMSSVAPILALAEELNPGLKKPAPPSFTYQDFAPSDDRIKKETK